MLYHMASTPQNYTAYLYFTQLIFLLIFGSFHCSFLFSLFHIVEFHFHLETFTNKFQTKIKDKKEPSLNFLTFLQQGFVAQRIPNEII
jgi:hypothetical protein